MLVVIVFFLKTNSDSTDENNGARYSISYFVVSVIPTILTTLT